MFSLFITIPELLYPASRWKPPHLCGGAWSSDHTEIAAPIDKGLSAQVFGIYQLLKCFKPLALAALLLFTAALHAQLTPQQAAGKQIYTQGVDPGGHRLVALLGDDSTRVSARLVPCTSCHGSDGLGRAEGDVVPANITWDVLARPFRSDTTPGRKRPPYTNALLRRAITRGVDSAGKRFTDAMPRYRIPEPDLDSLIAYIKVLGKQSDPGITADAIRIGMIVIREDHFVPAESGFGELLRAYFDQLNHQGGIYGRKVEFEVLEVNGPPSGVPRQVKDFVESRQIFALLTPAVPGASADWTEKLDIPIVAALTPAFDHPASVTQVFSVLPGITEQARALVKFARDRRENNKANPSMVVVYPDDRRTVADSIIEMSAGAGGASTWLEMNYSRIGPAQLVDSLRKENIRDIVFLGNAAQLLQLLASSRDLNWPLNVYQPGPLAGEEVFAMASQFADRVFLSLPALPSDLDAASFQEIKVLLQRSRSASSYPALSLATLASAKVLVEGLQQAGRNLTRERLADALSSLYGFNTGLTPAVTYGPNRRVGALGAYIVKLDLQKKTFVPVDSVFF
jgi:ABC-type branched-subunit amino acid transport system substrate-binding protein